MLLRLLSIAVFAISLHGGAAPAWSEVIWQDGKPIFQSDWFAFGHDLVGGTKSEALDKINRIDGLLPWRHAQTC